MNKNKGASAVEFALIIPVILVILYALMEVWRYLQVKSTISEAEHSIGEILARRGLDYTESNAAFDTKFLSTLIAPLHIENTTITSSCVQIPAGTTVPKVIWQLSNKQPAVTSIGAVGSIAQIPTSLLVNTSQAMIVMEFYYRYTPLFQSPMLNFKSFNFQKKSYHLGNAVTNQCALP